jgi:hypothetical protein
MQRFRILVAALALATLAARADAQTSTWFDFQVGIRGGSPPPPAIVFAGEPRYVMVDDVRVVRDDRCDDDLFMADRAYWRMRGGVWYRSATWRGPWVVIDVRRVPERVLILPARYWRHHPRHGYRPGTVVIRGSDRRRDRREDRRERRGREHDHDRDGDHDHRD